MMTLSAPCTSLPPLAIRPGHIHLWQLDLDHIEDRELSDYANLLSPAEQARASRFHFERDRRRSVLGRGFTRTVLARYAGVAPAALEVGANPFGKPLLLGAPGEWRFNVSHSGGLLLLAVTHQRAVGVDVEYMEHDAPLELLDMPHFSESDVQQIRTAPARQRTELFYQCWTRTEARLKAAGVGFAVDHFESVPTAWSLHTLTPAPGFSAALVVEGNDYQSISWQN